MAEDWRNGPNVRAAKLGTVPCLVRVHGADLASLALGRWVRVREGERGPWQRVLVTRVDPDDGHFFADR